MCPPINLILTKNMNNTIADYKIIEVIYEGNTTCVYRALRESDQTSVIIKILKTQYSNLAPGNMDVKTTTTCKVGKVF
ncbi:MAG: hypothetical protein C4323_25325, partial [Mastigocladus sp. ERB_26_2]